MQGWKAIKDPQAVLDYIFDWSAWLAGDTISTQTLTVDTGITIDSSEIGGGNTTVTAWVSGGTAGKSYRVTSRVTTAGGRTDERSIVILVRDR